MGYANLGSSSLTTRNSARKQFAVPFEESWLFPVGSRMKGRTSMKFFSLLALKAPG
jgi:hypothetical protein